MAEYEQIHFQMWGKKFQLWENQFNLSLFLDA